MISLLRAFTKSWIFQGVLVLLIASFAVYGLRDVFSSQSADAVVASGDRTVNTVDFKRIYENVKRANTERGGQPFTADQFVAAGQHIALIEQIADDTAFKAWLDKLGVKPSNTLIADQIAKYPAFFSGVTGRFDKDTYRNALAQNGMSEPVFQQEIADQIATSQYGDAALAGVKAPRVLAALESAFTLQTRDASIFTISPDTVAKPAAPTDSDLQAYYKQRIKDLNLPELRQASVVIFNPADVMKSIQPDEDALKKIYQQELPALGTPETRDFVQVTAPDMASAAAISAAMKSGQSPDAAAKAHGGKVIAMTGKSKDAVPDAKIAGAIFAMQPGDVSGAIQGELGIGVVKLTNVKPGSTPSYDSIRPKLLADYQQQKAADKVNQMVNDFQKAHDAGEDFNVTVQKMGLKAVPLLPMTSEGRTGDPQHDASKYPNLVRDVFDLQVGQSSDVEEMGKGVYFAVRLNEVKPAGPPPLDKVKPQLAQAWMIDKLATEVQAAADQAMASLNKGAPIAKVAADLHAPLTPYTGIDRDNTKKLQLPEGVIGNVFMSKPGETFQASLDRVHVAIGRVDAVHQADPAAANTTAAAVRHQMTQTVAQDVGDETRRAARSALKTKTNPAVAVRALDVTPPDAAGSSSSGKAKS